MLPSAGAFSPGITGTGAGAAGTESVGGGGGTSRSAGMGGAVVGSGVISTPVLCKVSTSPAWPWYVT
ncbi:MAG: hypothetical protein EBS13_04220 [Verrucomicrobia bacterium]|nr:hypothetical protein [Verrucomicrobiota bacterium]